MSISTALEYMREYSLATEEDGQKWEREQANLLREDWSSVYPTGSLGGNLCVEKVTCRRFPLYTVLLVWRKLDADDQQDQRWFQLVAPLPERFDCLVAYVDRTSEELRFAPYALSLLNSWALPPTLDAVV